MNAALRYTRETLQAVFARSLNDELKKCAVPTDARHMKLVIDALLRVTVLQALRMHLTVQEFAALAVNAYVSEITEGQQSSGGSHLRLKKVSND